MKGKAVTAIYSVVSVVLCISITLSLYAADNGVLSTIETVEANELSPAQQLLLDHLNNLENPDIRHALIFSRIEKLLEESYTDSQLQFADAEFYPEAGEAYDPVDIIVTDGSLVLNNYADIPDGTDSHRLMVLNTGACLIGSVPYFWGGKASKRGWNEHWGQDVVVSSGSFIAQVATEGSQPLRNADAEGSQVLIPYGLDCSGFVDWAYWTALNYRLGGSTRQQWANSNEITEDELLPGDLGFLCSPNDAAVNHVGMYIGKNKDGKKMWLHCSSDKGVNVSSPKFIYFRRPNIDIYY